MQPSLLFLFLFLATSTAFHLPVPSGVASSRMSVPAMRAKKKGAAAAVDVSQVADEIVDTIDPVEEIAQSPPKQTPKLPDVDMEAVEDFAVMAFKFTSSAVRGVIAFGKENDVLGKVQGAAKAAVDFERQNEVLLKTRAALELGAEEVSQLGDAAKSMTAKPVAKKAAVEEPAAKKPAAGKNTKKGDPKFKFAMPTMPKFK
jgi:hypothetical protein